MTRRGPISPPHNHTGTRAARDRPVRAGHPTFAETAVQLLEQGYEPLPIRSRGKAPVPSGWNSGAVDAERVARWCRDLAECGIGLRTGHLVAIDIDILDEDLAHEAEQKVRAALGDTPLVRVGLWPKRVLLYRTLVPFRKLAAGGIEVLADGQQFVAFGIHPKTGRPYYWPSRETPLAVPFGALPVIDEAMCRDLLGTPTSRQERIPRAAGRKKLRAAGPAAPVRGERGLVVDGRDTWLSQIAYHVVQDTIDAGRAPDIAVLVREVWTRFERTTDLDRGRGDSSCAYGPADAERKVRDKLRLHRDGRLPPRGQDDVEADYQAPTLSPDEARAALDRLLGDACRAIEDWHESQDGPAPQIGIRATVGLGKSVRARKHVLALRERLRQQGLPSRIAVFTPSHSLAEEAAAGWRKSGLQVAVLRGYHAKDPPSGEPMCRDTDAVDIAIRAGVDVGSSACRNRTGQTCPFIEGCWKQENLREVAAADVVIAAYDTLFTGFSGGSDDIGIVIIDEGCWQRAWQEHDPIPLDLLERGPVGSVRPRTGFDAEAETADLHALRRRLHAVLSGCEGAVARGDLLAGGLTESECRLAVDLEERLVRNPKLRPGLQEQLRRTPRSVAEMNARARSFAALWSALADPLAGGADRDGRVSIMARNGKAQVLVRAVKPMHRLFSGRPVLHLDATLRPELARTVLPRLRHQEVEAGAPHMRVTLVKGSFGKGMICPRGAGPERKRRQNRLRECVDYVRWQAARFAPERVLVVTYKEIERAFAGIPNVALAHFNAIAGLDTYRDVRLLVVVGRPLPSNHDLLAPAAALLAHSIDGNYRKVTRGVRMRDGSSRGIEVIEHIDGDGELFRTAICDDEVIQAIGRGRGVNRAAETPLDVHVLADVALPLVHDRVVAWEGVKPDIVQRMLLAGVAVDSPGDAAHLHPGIFANANQAKLAFRTAGFGCQNPIRDPYREMTLKSTTYRRSGRGRSWQRVWWFGASAAEARQRLEAVLGNLADWRSD